MMLRMILFISTALLLKFVVADTDENDAHTIQYTDSTFSTEVPKKNHFIMFFAPWCGHCRRLEPTWKNLAEKFNENNDNSQVTIGKVDCTTDSSVCSQNDVTGYPTLKFFKEGESTGIKFRGTRDLQSLTSFINEQLGSAKTPNDDNEINTSVPEPINGLVELTEDTFDDHVSSGLHFVKFYAPWCGHCQRLAPTWDELGKSNSHDKLVNIAKVDCTQHQSVCEKFDIKGYPTLLWIENGKKIDKYTGQRGTIELKEYINKMLKKSTENIDDNSVIDDDSVQSVLTLTGESFEHGIIKGITLVKFFAPWCGHCKRLASTWEELGKKFITNDNVHIVKIDCTLQVNKQLCDEQEVEGFPTLFLYKNGKKISEYNGSRTLDDLYEFIIKHQQDHDEL
ncbi:hypothetical protein HCN44_005227 [Aphidius gifuensis]|uniref:Thioredoxin domain-containing protein n=1 Tax=Aphidius gifuensis TaxID=684658 RepID=A0A835CT41_APHGI|nr:thioredoxin domain-containing protein 5 homolog [Aphidius gifuensis]KAF7992883.1 hypothetical protein HCN44_005227 [Aphidius gifuensis]